MSARVERGTVHTVRSVGFCSTVHTIRSVGFCGSSELPSRDDETPSLNKIEKRTSLSSGGSLGQSLRDSALSPAAKARPEAAANQARIDAFMMYQQAYDTNLQSAVIVWMDTTSGFFKQPRVPPLCGPVAAVAPASSGMTEVNAPCPDPGTKLKTLSVGTDCSGMEAPIQALQNM